MEFDPMRCSDLNIRKVHNGILVSCGCRREIVFTTYKAFDRELRGFLSGKLGPIGLSVWRAYLAELKKTGPGTPTPIANAAPQLERIANP
jgi:hypothetical protein